MSEKLIIRDDRTPFQIGAAIAQGNFSALVSCLPGIMLAAVIYPILIGLIGLVAFLIVAGGFLPGPEEWYHIFGIVAVYCVFISIVAAILAVIVGVFASGLLAVFNWTLGNIISIHRLVPLAGGLTGFIPTAAIVWVQLPFIDLWGLLIVLGAIWLAVLSGQIGAVWFFERHVLVNRRQSVTDEVEFRFQISQLLAVTFWIALVCALSPALAMIWREDLPALAGLALPMALLVWFVLHLIARAAVAFTRKLRNANQPIKPKSLGHIQIHN